MLKRPYLGVGAAILSAVLYGCAPYTTITSFISLICLVPLFWAVLMQDDMDLPLWAGFLFGAIASLLQLATVFYSIAHGIVKTGFITRILILIPPLGYTALLGLLFFSIPKLFAKLSSSQTIRSIGWIVGSFVYFKSFAHWCMAPFGRIEGYILTNPLLPLARVPALLFPMRIIGEAMTLLLLCTLMFLCALTIYYLTKALLMKLFASLLIIIGTVSVWILSGIYLYKKEPHTDLTIIRNKIVSCPFFSNFSPDIKKVVPYIGYIFYKAQKQFPHATIFISQESSTHVDQWDTNPILGETFSEMRMTRPIKIVLGGFRWNENKYHNSLYFFDNEKLVQWHDKRHSIALDERIPWIADFAWVKNAFFGNLIPTCPSKNPRKAFKLDSDLAVVPYICSEFFFNNWPDEDPKLLAQHLPILICSNDYWGRFEYLQENMQLYVRYCAIYWNRTIIYNAYHRNAIVASDGSSIPMQTFDEIKKRSNKKKEPAL